MTSQVYVAPGPGARCVPLRGGLRAEAYISTRTYTLTYQARDAAGNTQACAVPVSVDPLALSGGTSSDWWTSLPPPTIWNSALSAPWQ